MDERNERLTWTPWRWAIRINAEVTITAQAIIAIGILLLEAKAALGYGRFEEVFVDLHFSRRMGEFYMAIARNKVLTNAKWISHLPTTVVTLLELNRLDPLQLEAALADGRVHPKLQRDEARVLSASSNPSEAWTLADAEERLRHAINAEIDAAPSEDRDQIPELVQWLVNAVREARDPNRHADAQAALDDLEIRDAEPGAFKNLETPEEAAFHPGAQVVTYSKSTHGSWYPPLTFPLTDPLTKKVVEGALDRETIEHRLHDILIGNLPTRRTARSYAAVLAAIKGLGRRFGN